MNYHLLLFLLFCFVWNSKLYAQYNQTIRGVVVDKQSQQTIPGANVVLLNYTPLIGSTTNADGKFKLENVPVGRQQLKISFIGYKEAFATPLVTTGKEVVLTIEIEENIVQAKEVVITATQDKTQSINEMNTVSVRQFSVEEANRYAGSFNDPARMATNYAGAVGTSDVRNDIVIRGNSPTGVLWRLDGYDIPSPNHFSTAGVTGGAVSILNNNLLSNSDFMTGAFAAEYSNAMSGVFDLKLRNGNNEKHEFIAQVGFNGFEGDAEGPISKKNGSSYMVAYRYSILSFIQKLGINYGSSSIPRFQDLAAKLNFPLKKGVISWYFVGGLGTNEVLSKNIKETDFIGNDGFDLYVKSTMSASALSYLRNLKHKDYIKFTLGTTFDASDLLVDSLDVARINSATYRKEINQRYKNSFNFLYNRKVSSQLTCKAGAFSDRTAYLNTNKRFYGSIPKTIFDANGSCYLIRAYAEAIYRITDRFNLNPGLNYNYLLLNNTQALEPRLGLSYAVKSNQKLNLAYGLHGRMQDLPIYFVKTITAGNEQELNKQLGFSKSHHFVLGYDINISEHVRIKTETYYQYLFNIPVEQRSSAFSLINSGADFALPYVDSLQNKGTGTNYGVEYTLERFLHKGLYFFTTVSLYQSKYKGSNNNEYNTAFNGNYACNFLIGKEFNLNQRLTITTDLKATYAAGRRYIPIDLNKSIAKGAAFIDVTRPYSAQFNPYFRTDFKIGLRQNFTKSSHEIAISMTNLTNNKNIFSQNYSAKTQKISNTYQLGFVPLALYRLNF